MPTLIISGALANKPFNGGNAWSRLSWISGFRQHGWQVLFVEEISSRACVDEEGSPTTNFRASANRAYFRMVMNRFGLTNDCALLCDGGREVEGLSLPELVKRGREAVLLFNFSGHLTHPELKANCRGKIYYDDDPGFTQFWQVSGTGGSRLAGHDFFYTLGARIGSPDCEIPTGGLAWRPTRPPVGLEDWPFCPGQSLDRLSTVASWRGPFAPIQYGGKTYGLKVHEFRKFLDLPRRIVTPCEIALQIHPGDAKDLAALQAHGWQVLDPRQVASTPAQFRGYVRHSGAEFSAAQGIYVDTRSGWCSDRTVKYLASGRPALVQETGLSQILPTGSGLLTFVTLEEAVASAERLARDYAHHAQAARRMAQDYFAADKVVGAMLKEIGV